MQADAIVVGSGAGGVAAALGLAGRRVLVLDVGREPASRRSPLTENVYDLKRTGTAPFDALIGSRYESLHNVHRPYLTPKLKAPGVRYVSEGWSELSPVTLEGFDAVMSFAKGGLGNAWGAGVYRFNAVDLRGFPITVADLDPFYDELTRHLGVSGTDDDLAEDFGTSEGCLPPLERNDLGRDLLTRYRQHRAHFGKLGIRIGTPRMAVLSREFRGRGAYDYNGLEFFQPHTPAIYNPAFTLDELVAEGAVEYASRRLVLGYSDGGDGVRVRTRHVETGAEESFEARKLVLAAGALNTARLVLASSEDHETRLPLLDNRISYVPFLNVWRIGAGVETKSLPIQLNLVYEAPGQAGPIQGSIYGVGATLWCDFLFDFPFAARDNMRALKYLMPAMVVVQLFYPDEARPENYLRLGADGRMVLHYEKRALGEVEAGLIRGFRRIGYFGSPRLCKFPMAGSSYHYAGGLPMRTDPGRYETDPEGRLSGRGNVFIADPANFSTLPSKNLTFTNMANAMRIGRLVAGELAAS